MSVSNHVIEMLLHIGCLAYRFFHSLLLFTWRNHYIKDQRKFISSAMSNFVLFLDTETQ